MNSEKQTKIPVKREKKRRSFILNIVKIVQDAEAVVGSGKIQSENMIEKLQKDNQQQTQQHEKEMGTLTRSNRLMIDAYQIYQTFNVPIRQGNILLKIFDQILNELHQSEVSSIKFQHKNFYHNLFATDNNAENDTIMSMDSIQERDFQRTWNLATVKQEVILAKKNVLLQQINFIVSRNEFSTFLLAPTKSPAPTDKKISILKSLQRMTEIAKGKLKDGKSRNSFKSGTGDENPKGLNKKMMNTTLRKKLSDQKKKNQSQYNKNFLHIEDKGAQNGFTSSVVSSRSRISSSIQEQIQRLHYNITWNSTKKEYNKLFRQNVNEQYKFIEHLNQIVKNKIETKEETDLKFSLSQNSWFVVPFLVIFMLGFFGLMILSADSFLLKILIGVWGFMIIWLIFKFMKQEIYSNDSYRSEINQILLDRYEESSSDFILQLSEDNLNIRVLNRQVN